MKPKPAPKPTTPAERRAAALAARKLPPAGRQLLDAGLLAILRAPPTKEDR